MTTLAVMKASIVGETDRDDLLVETSGAGNSPIGLEIARAIQFYQPQRFWFNEKRATVTFSTVIDQDTYTLADNEYISDLIRIDWMMITENGASFDVEQIDPAYMDRLLGASSVLVGGPRRYAYYDQQLRLYPRPNAVLPVQIAGVIPMPAPVSDGEANNVWMTKAEELIRARAKRNLYLNWLGGTDRETIATMQSLEAEKLDALKRETSSRSQVSRLRPSGL